MSTRMRIDRLVLKNVPPGQRTTVVAALRAELVRRLGTATLGQGRTVLLDVPMPPRAYNAPMPPRAYNAPAPGSAAQAGRVAAAAVVRAAGGGR